MVQTKQTSGLMCKSKRVCVPGAWFLFGNVPGIAFQRAQRDAPKVSLNLRPVENTFPTSNVSLSPDYIHRSLQLSGHSQKEGNQFPQACVGNNKRWRARRYYIPPRRALLCSQYQQHRVCCGGTQSTLNRDESIPLFHAAAAEPIHVFISPHFAAIMYTCVCIHVHRPL